jgi:hypothetical protein
MVGEVQQHEMLKFAEVEKRLKKIEHICRALTTARPLHMVTTQRGTPIRVGALAQVDDSQKPAVLHRNPKTLDILWNEWMNGIAGNLPARKFTRSQRGAKGVKANFSYRKPFWRIMQRLLDHQSTSDEAIKRIDRVYSRYGSITKQLKQMAIDEKNGGHRNLQTPQAQQDLRVNEEE